MMIFACVEKGERLRRVFFQNSKIPNLSLISAFRTFTQTTITIHVLTCVSVYTKSVSSVAIVQFSTQNH